MTSLEIFSSLFYTSEQYANSAERGPVTFQMLCIVPSQVWELEKMPMPQEYHSVRWLGYTTVRVQTRRWKDEPQTPGMDLIHGSSLI